MTLTPSQRAAVDADADAEVLPIIGPKTVPEATAGPRRPGHSPAGESGRRGPGCAAPGGETPRILARARRSPATCAPERSSGDGRDAGERHVIELRHSLVLSPRQALTVYGHCVCGWSGPRHVLQPHAPDVAHHAADYDGDQHLAQPDKPPPTPTRRRKRGAEP